MRNFLIAGFVVFGLLTIPQAAQAGGGGGFYWGFGYSTYGYPAYRGRGWRYGGWAAPRRGVYFGIPYAGYPNYIYGRSYYVPPRSRAYYNRYKRRGHVRRAYGRPAAWTPAWYRYCAAKYRSFQSAHPRHYLAYSGRYRMCR